MINTPQPVDKLKSVETNDKFIYSFMYKDNNDTWQSRMIMKISSQIIAFYIYSKIKKHKFKFTPLQLCINSIMFTVHMIYIREFA